MTVPRREGAATRGGGPGGAAAAPALAVLAAVIAAAACDGRGPGDEPGALPADADGAGSAGPLFVEVDARLAPMVCGRPGAPTILETNGGGVAIFDGDGDGDQDLLLVIPGDYPEPGAAGGGTNRLYRNDGGRLVDVTAGSGVDVPGFCNGVAVGDFDSDGDRDLFLTRHGPDVLLANVGDLRFETVPDAAGAAGRGWSTSAVFVDLDRDGDPDLYVARYLEFDPARPPLHGEDGRPCVWKGQPVMCGPQGLRPQADAFYRNEGGRFVEDTAAAGFEVAPGFGLGVVDGDFDDDGWPDLYVANDSTPNHMFLNRRDGTVREAGMLTGTALSARGREQAGMGIAAGDLDGDGREDLMVTNFSEDANAVYLSEGAGMFRDQADPAGLGGPSRPWLGWGVAFLDADLDGDLDVVTANGHVYPQADAPGTDTSFAQPDVLSLNDGRGRFLRVPWPGDALAVSRALAAGDLDDDGVQDLVITRLAGPPAVWRGTARGRVVRVAIVGPPGNPDGVGSRLSWEDGLGTRVARVRTSGGYQSAHDPRVTFAWRGPGTLRVEFPDGARVERALDAPGTVRLVRDAP